MATLRMPDVDEVVHERLRRQAAEPGRSVEAEVRAILAAATHVPEKNFLQTLRECTDENGVDLEPYLPARNQRPREVDFG